MSKLSRASAIILSLVLIFSLLSACGSEKTPAETTAPSESAAPTAAPSPAPSAEAPADGSIKLPIVDDPVTFTIWETFQSTVVASPADVKANQELERLTNVHIEYQTAASADAASSFNLMMASQEYPDILFSCATVPRLLCTQEDMTRR